LLGACGLGSHVRSVRRSDCLILLGFCKCRHCRALQGCLEPICSAVPGQRRSTPWPPALLSCHCHSRWGPSCPSGVGAALSAGSLPVGERGRGRGNVQCVVTTAHTELGAAPLMQDLCVAAGLPNTYIGSFCFVFIRGTLDCGALGHWSKSGQVFPWFCLRGSSSRRERIKEQMAIFSMNKSNWKCKKGQGVDRFCHVD
jgi:hypothetical protein